MGYRPPGRTLVTVATFNEKDNLPRLLEEILLVLDEGDILVVDDNSPDGTGQLADAFAESQPRVAVLHRTGKLGLGTAILAGLRHGLERGYDFIINLDADFSHPPKDLPALLNGMTSHDVMIGSRYVAGGGIEGWDWKRHVMSRGINLISRLLLGIRARDCSGSFRCYRGELLRKVDFARVRSRGYSFQEEFLFRCQRAGARIGETPIRFINREKGASKINPREAITSLWTLFAVALE